MKQKIFTVHDGKALSFNRPFFYPTEGQATRDFHQVVNDGESQQSKYPADFSLFVVGEFDTDTGLVESYSTPKLVCTGLELKQKEL